MGSCSRLTRYLVSIILIILAALGLLFSARVGKGASPGTGTFDNFEGQGFTAPWFLTYCLPTSTSIDSSGVLHSHLDNLNATSFVDGCSTRGGGNEYSTAGLQGRFNFGTGAFGSPGPFNAAILRADGKYDSLTSVSPENRYDIYVNIYWKFDSPVASSKFGSTHQWMDSQQRFLLVSDSVIQPVGQPEVDNGFSDRFFYAEVAEQATPGQTFNISIDVPRWYQRALAAFGITDPGAIVSGIQLGFEGYGVIADASFYDLSIVGTSNPTLVAWIGIAVGVILLGAVAVVVLASRRRWRKNSASVL